MSTVLIVDDEEETRYILQQALNGSFNVAMASDARSALELVQSRAPDLIIADLHMPGCNGLELLKAAHEQDPHLPVVIVTGSGSVDTAVEAIHLGAYDYIMKPFDDLDAVRHSVRRALEARALRRENERLVAEMRQANAFKGQLLRTVSHDYKNLLTVIVGYGRLAQINPEADQVTESLERILNTARLMTHMAEDLSVYSQIDANALHLVREHISIHDCAENAVQNSLVDRTRVPIVLPDETVHAWGDSIRTTQILTNLVGNAFKYSPAGGEIRIDARHEGDQVQVSVTDHGLGIPASALDQLFQPFFRLDRDATSGTPGSGLGLTIVRSLVELQGGRVWCKSREGVGSTFHFTVPAREPPA